jgi:site-specific DNA-methyltransferase (adenine-specific)
MIQQGDCLKLVKSVENEYFHAIITDPPYGIEWLGNDWDNPNKLWDQRNLDYPSARGTNGKHNLNAYEAGEKFYLWFKPIAQEMFRTLKAGGSCLIFSSTQTDHWVKRPLEEAGFKIKDTLMWNYHTGFPKAISVPFLIDRRLGLVEKAEAIGHEPLSPEAKEWEGWVTGKLKPAYEPIVWAVKPCNNTIDAMLTNGVGGINVGETRIPTNPDRDGMLRSVQRTPRHPDNVLNFDNCGIDNKKSMFTGVREEGRFPANIVIINGELINKPKFNVMYEVKNHDQPCEFTKPNRAERDMGLEESGGNPIQGDVWDKKLLCRNCGRSVRKPETTCGCANPQLDWKKSKRTIVRNMHPTVKPVSLFEHLLRLVTRPGQRVADFFMGSGTAGMACKKLSREFWGCEIQAEYFKIAEMRINNSYNTADPWDF